MRLSVAASLALLLAWPVAVLPAAAQDQPAAPAPQTPAAPPAGAEKTPAPAPNANGEVSDQDALAQCKDAAMAKGLDEDARHKAIAQCVIDASPKIARRIRCLMDPNLRTLDKEARDAAIIACIEGKPAEAH